jgi:CheY-like chemotaxis protein
MKIEDKLSTISNVGDQVVKKQSTLIKRLRDRVFSWNSLIDQSILNDKKIELRVNETQFNRDINLLSSNQSILQEYMGKWDINAGEKTHYEDIKKFLYANDLEELSRSREDIREKIFLKRKFTDFNNSLNYYDQMLIHQHRDILLLSDTQKTLKLSLYILFSISFLSFTAILVITFKDIFSQRHLNGERFNVLFVDDDEEVLDVLVSSNESLVNCKFLQASDGMKALDVLKRHRVDLIITDLCMPNMGGVELIAKLERKNVPVIVMTSKDFLSIEARKQLKGQHIYDKFDLLYRMDEIIGQQLNLGRSIRENKMAS